VVVFFLFPLHCSRFASQGNSAPAVSSAIFVEKRFLGVYYERNCDGTAPSRQGPRGGPKT